ncbi:hypothetical protein N9C66_06635 [Akkermansiaceae bacterium]|nr:hypothetical protein [Akkermansiaceae bacterium]MDB4423478.1 hypothetical protein [bacterium]MDA7930128.1 hypothetical protein [Akkermansiaceae bacterium]MDA7934521.1 hypothetical protein [Akkermansiaceae bacterium]MDA9831000.1 hypothetical protein [Akkermansiaceae bacterium]
MSSSSEVICRPTKWFIWRAVLMLVMFGGFGAYFLYDWKIGYPKKNYVVANYVAFNKAGEAWTVDENRASPEVWNAFVEKQTIPFDEDRSIYPANTDFEEKWPEILKEMDNHKSDDLWMDYSGEKGWPQKVNVEDDPKTAGQIREQLYAACVCFALTAIALFFLIRTKGRAMKVDEKGYYPPGGDLIPFSAMKTLDKRKWETKGLATLTYEADGEEKKAKIDGMVYGQFKEEDGAPAEALFQKVLENFEGELIELVDEDEDDEADDEAPEDEDKGSASGGDSDDSVENE